MSTVYWRAARFAPASITTLLRGNDEAWPAIVRRLGELRAGGRYSVRMVEAGHGSGALLIRAARLARALGFTAVEARVIDREPPRTALASAMTDAPSDWAIGVTCDAVDPLEGVRQEHACPADILVWHGGVDRVEAAVLAAAEVVIVDPFFEEITHATV